MNRGFDRTVLFGALRADAAHDARTMRAPLVAVEGLPAGRDGGATTALPDPAPPVRGIEETLLHRSAVRDYAERPLTLAQVSAMLTSAHAQDADTWAGERAAGVGLRLLCAAWRVSPLEVGLHAFDESTRTLTRLSPLPTGPAAADLVLQREFADAPAIVMVLGDLGAAVRRHGSHGYRLLLTRAGAAAHAAWLTAVGLGLDGSLFAGLLPSALRELAGVDGYTSAPLFAFSVGWPPDATPSPGNRVPEGGERNGKIQ